MIKPVNSFSEELKKNINDYNRFWERAYAIAGQPAYLDEFDKLIKQISCVKKKIDIVLETEPYDELKAAYIHNKIHEDLIDLSFFDSLGNDRRYNNFKKEMGL